MKSRSQYLVTESVIDGKTSSQKSYTFSLGTNLTEIPNFQDFQITSSWNKGILLYIFGNNAEQISSCQCVFSTMPTTQNGEERRSK